MSGNGVPMHWKPGPPRHPHSTLTAILPPRWRRQADVVFTRCTVFRVRMHCAGMMDLMGIPYTHSGMVHFGDRDRQGTDQAALVPHGIPMPAAGLCAAKTSMPPIRWPGPMC